MRSIFTFLVAAGLAVAPSAAFAQEGASQSQVSVRTEKSEPAAKHEEGGEEGGLQGWKWANFLVLAAGLGYLIGKNGGPFFASRGKQIREDMEKAGDRLKQAEARAAEAEAKLAGLQSALGELREQARKSEEAEARRGAQRAAEEVAKIRTQAELEIASAGKAARMELKQYAAHLAVELAEAKIRGGMTPQTQEALIAGFAEDLVRPEDK